MPLTRFDFVSNLVSIVERDEDYDPGLGRGEVVVRKIC